MTNISKWCTSSLNSGLYIMAIFFLLSFSSISTGEDQINKTHTPVITNKTGKVLHEVEVPSNKDFYGKAVDKRVLDVEDTENYLIEKVTNKVQLNEVEVIQNNERNEVQGKASIIRESDYSSTDQALEKWKVITK